MDGGEVPRHASRHLGKLRVLSKYKRNTPMIIHHN